MTERIAHYDLIEVLGQGPNGTSHLAVDTNRDRMVVLRRFSSLRGVAWERFEPLAHALADVRGEELAPIYGLSPESESTPYVTREYVSGLDLDTLRRQCALQRTFMMAIAAATARGVASLHAASLAHGNVKPSNVIVEQSGGVRLTDPSLAGRLLAGRDADVASGSFGDPRFMGPDQLETGEPSPRGDVHALGVLLHLLLTGELPFRGDDPASIRAQALRGEYPALPPDLPAPLAEVVEAALPRQGRATTLTAAEIASRLAEWLSEQGHSVRDALADGAQSVSYAFLMANVRAPQEEPRLAAPPARPAAPTSPPAAGFDLDLEEDLSAPPPPAATAPVPEALELSDDSSRGPTPAPAPVAPPARPRPPSEPAPAPAVRRTEERRRQIGWTIALVVAIGLTIAWGTLWHDGGSNHAEGAPAAGEESREDPAARLQEARDAARGAPADAVYAARRAVELNPESGEAHLLLGRALLRAEKADEAAESLTVATRLSPGEIEPQRLLIEALLARGLNQPAVTLARKALAQHGSDARLHKLIARGELGDRRFDAAIDALETASRLNPEDADTFFLLGETLSKQGDHAAARDAYRNAIRFRPRHGPAYAGLGRSLLALGQGGEAADVLADGLRLVPDSAEVRYAVGRVMLHDGRTDEAIPHLDRYARDNPSDWRGWFSLGLARLRGGKPERAATAFERAAALRSNQPEIHYDLGMARIRAGRDDAAALAFDKAIEARYDLWAAHCERGKALHRAGRREEALKSLAAAARYNPKAAVATRLTADLPAEQAALLVGLPCGPPDLDIR